MNQNQIFNVFCGVGKILVGHEAVLAHDYKTLSVRRNNSPYYTHRLFAVAKPGEYRELCWSHAVDFKAQQACQSLLESTDKDFVEVILDLYGGEIFTWKVSNPKGVAIYIAAQPWDESITIGNYTAVPCLIEGVEHVLYFQPTFKQWDKEKEECNSCTRDSLACDEPSCRE